MCVYVCECVCVYVCSVCVCVYVCEVYDSWSIVDDVRGSGIPI